MGREEKSHGVQPRQTKKNVWNLFFDLFFFSRYSFSSQYHGVRIRVSCLREWNERTIWAIISVPCEGHTFCPTYVSCSSSLRRKSVSAESVRLNCSLSVRRGQEKKPPTLNYTLWKQKSVINIKTYQLFWVLSIMYAGQMHRTKLPSAFMLIKLVC